LRSESNSILGHELPLNKAMKQQSCGEICTNPAFKYLQVAKHERYALEDIDYFLGAIFLLTNGYL